MTKKEWTLLVIAAAGGAGLQPVQLQKTLFLLSRRLTPARLGTGAFYQFEPYDYGPFCGKVYSDADELREEGLIEIDYPTQRRYREYRTTEHGKERASEILKRISPEARAYLDVIVQWVRNLSFNDLVEAIYKAFPDMAVNSVFARTPGNPR